MHFMFVYYTFLQQTNVILNLNAMFVMLLCKMFQHFAKNTNAVTTSVEVPKYLYRGLSLIALKVNQKGC